MHNSGCLKTQILVIIIANLQAPMFLVYIKISEIIYAITQVNLWPGVEIRHK